MDAAHLRELGERLGPGGVLSDPIDLARYTTPFRGPAGRTPAVVRPTTVEQVREVVAWARRHRIRLLPQGANSGLVGASTPPPVVLDGSAPVVVSLERLDDPPVIDPVDRTATVTAGTRLSRLSEAAARHGLFLPIDLGADPSIGGMVATNTGGARMVRHGDMRRHVLGVRAVIADDACSVVDELTTLRKHNVGPSMTELFVGSSGAFGIITDVALELQRIPEARACAWCIPRSDHAALDALVRLETTASPWLAAFEAVSSEALTAAGSAGGGTNPFAGQGEPELAVLVEFAGDAHVEDRLVESLADLFDAELLEDAMVMPTEQAWAPRHAISEGLRRAGTVLGFDVAAPRSSLPALRGRLREVVRSLEPTALVADFGHWGDGGIHCNVVLTGAPSAEQTARLREAVLRTVVEDFGGSFSAEHGIGPHNADWWRATVPAPVQGLTRSIKSLVDPLGVLGHPGLPY